MSEVYVFGHKNPDTDSICASIAYAEFKQKQGVNAKPIRLGELNPETRFVLDKFGVEEPDKMHNFEGKDVILIDHTKEEESGENIKKAHILEIIDHHALGSLQTFDQVFARIEPVGSSSTIIYKIYKESNIEIEDKIEGLLL